MLMTTDPLHVTRPSASKTLSQPLIYAPPKHVPPKHVRVFHCLWTYKHWKLLGHVSGLHIHRHPNSADGNDSNSRQVIHHSAYMSRSSVYISNGISLTKCRRKHAPCTFVDIGRLILLPIVVVTIAKVLRTLGLLARVSSNCFSPT